MKEMSEIEKIRRHIGLSRKSFGAIVGRKWQSIWHYDRGEKEVPEKIMDRARRLYEFVVNMQEEDR